MQLNDTVLLIIEILYILTVVSIVVVVISENRSPIKAVAWILAVMFLPVIGIIWYLIFGQDTTKKRVISKRMYSKLKRRPLDEMEDAADMEVGLDKGLKRHDNLIKLLKNLDYTPLLGVTTCRFLPTPGISSTSFSSISNRRSTIYTWSTTCC